MSTQLIKVRSKKSSLKVLIKDRITLQDSIGVCSQDTSLQQFKILAFWFAHHQSMSFNCLTNSESNQISCKVYLNEELSLCCVYHQSVSLLLISFQILLALEVWHQSRTSLLRIVKVFLIHFIHDVLHLMKYHPWYLTFLIMSTFLAFSSSFSSSSSLALIQTEIPTQLILLDLAL